MLTGAVRSLPMAVWSLFLFALQTFDRFKGRRALCVFALLMMSPYVVDSYLFSWPDQPRLPPQLVIVIQTMALAALAFAILRFRDAPVWDTPSGLVEDTVGTSAPTQPTVPLLVSGTVIAMAVASQTLPSSKAGIVLLATPWLGLPVLTAFRPQFSGKSWFIAGTIMLAYAGTIMVAHPYLSRTPFLEPTHLPSGMPMAALHFLAISAAAIALGVGVLHLRARPTVAAGPLPPPLADPLLMLRGPYLTSTFFCGLWSLLLFARAALLQPFLEDAGEPIAPLVAPAVGCALGFIGNLALVLLCLPHREPDSLYLRSFRKDVWSARVRRAVRRGFVSHLRLSGIRAPGRRMWRWLRGADPSLCNTVRDQQIPQS